MSDFQKVQQQVNERADQKLRAKIAAAVVLEGFNKKTLIKGLSPEMELGELLSKIRSELFENSRDAWRTRLGKEFIESVWGVSDANGA